MFAKNKIMSLVAHKIVPLVMIFSLLAADCFAAYFYFKDNSNLMKGCPGTVEIGLNTEGARILAADAVMYFDATQATVQSLGLGSILPMPTYNNILGQKLSLSGARFPMSGVFNGDGIFGMINLTPSLTATKLNLNFSEDLVNDIIIAEDVTFENAATKVESKEFAVKDRYNSNIESGFCTPDTIPPAVLFVMPANGSSGVLVDSNVVFSLSDNRAGVDISTLSYTIKGVTYTEQSPQATVTDSNGTYRVETNPVVNFFEGDHITTSVTICDLNVPANCATRQGSFFVYAPPPPDPVCGDGITTYQAGEQCDDGNTLDGDGCSSLCLWEQPESEVITEVVTEVAVCPEPETGTTCTECETCPVYEATAETQVRPSAGVGGVEEEKFAWDELAAPEITESIDGCTREDITKEIMDKFDVLARYSARDAACIKDIEHCMLPFLIHTSYKDADLAVGKYYPDLFTEKEQGDRVLLQGEGAVTQEFKNAITFATRIGMVQGFYEDVVNLSPFRPKYNMTRAQIIKVLNWAVLGQEWQYEEEYWAQIGGKGNWELVKRPFNDLTEWWYPRYLNVACEKGIIECNENTSFGPNEVCNPTWKRDIMAKYLVYYKQQNETGFEDTDKDTIIDRDEKNVFYTDHTDADTDKDGLDDGTEITIYKSNPVLADTDGDGLLDGEEVKIHKTDPLKRDTDGDGYSDGLEVKLGSSPTNPKSTPADANQNGIDDDWEKKYGISPVNGTDDTDGDGLSDLMEYRYGTDPTLKDTDGDGLSDSEEILIYKSDPNAPTNLENIGVRITNMHDGMILTDLRPFIQGVGPSVGMEISLILRNEFGHEIVLGKTYTDNKKAFTFTPTFDLRDGRFYLLAKGLDNVNKRVIQSPLVYVTLNSALKIDSPTPERLSNTTLTQDVVIEGLRVVIGSDRTPMLVGRTGFKNKVVATWESVLGTSAIVADLAGGEFRIRAPEELDYGAHKVTLYAIRDEDQAMSKKVIVNFEVKEPFTQVLHGIAFGEEVIFPNYVWVVIFVIGAGLVFYGAKAGKLFRKKRK